MKVAFVLFSDASSNGCGNFMALQDRCAMFLEANGAIPKTEYWTCDEGFRAKTFIFTGSIVSVENIAKAVSETFPEFFTKKNIKNNYDNLPFFCIAGPPGADISNLEEEYPNVVRIFTHDDIIRAFERDTLEWYGLEHFDSKRHTKS